MLLSELRDKIHALRLYGSLQVFNLIADHLLNQSCPHTLRVAVDGIDCAGKTTMADGLARELLNHKRPVIRASADDFLRPRTERYRRGRYDPQGYFHDSFDYQALIDQLLLPLGPQGTGRFRMALAGGPDGVRETDGWQTALEQAIMICDGVFLQRPELYRHWDFRIFAAVSWEVAMTRALARDTGRLGSQEEVRRLYNERYYPAQRLYVQTCRPADRADLIVWNDIPSEPHLEWKA